MTRPRSPLLPSRRTLALVFLCLVGLTASAVGVATAAPPPQELCGVCGDGLERAAEDAGVPLTIEHSTARITVDADGSGHWHARVGLSPAGAATLAANATRRERLVRETLDRRTVVERPSNLSTRVENDTLVADFDAPVATTERAGVTLVAFAPPGGVEGSVSVVADRLTVRGPGGTVATRAPAGARVDGRDVVWTGGGWFGTGPELAFAASGGPVGDLATSVALVSDAASRTGPGTLLAGGVPALAFLAGLGLLVRFDGYLPAVPSSTAAAVAVVLGAGVTAVGAVAAALDALDPGFFPPLAVAAGLYAVAGAAPLVLDDPSTGRLSAWLVGTGSLAVLLGGMVSATALRAVIVTAPALVFLPLGAARRDRRSRAVLGVALVAVPLLVATQAGSVEGLFGVVVFTVFVALPWTVLTLTLGAVLYLAGRPPLPVGRASDRPAPGRRERRG
jgi:hypothetical protein